MMFVILVAILLSSITSFWFFSKRERKSGTNEHVEHLKNALLTYAISRLRRNDFDDMNFAYRSFDGTKLPSMSGYNLTNACFSYIQNKETFRRQPLYSVVMEDKIVAIDKYLDKQFDTRDKVIDFFDEFTQAFQTKIEDIEGEESTMAVIQEEDEDAFDVAGSSVKD